MLPAWLLPAAAITAVIAYIAWAVASSGLLALTAATLFWLSVMALVAYAVQRGVQRRSGRR